MSKVSSGLMSIEDAGDICKRYGYRAFIAVGVRDDGTVDVMSHAASEADCRVIGEYAQGQFAANLPRVPFQTWFGWGNGGQPRALSAAELASLGHYGRQYAQSNTAPAADFKRVAAPSIQEYETRAPQQLLLAQPPGER